MSDDYKLKWRAVIAMFDCPTVDRRLIVKPRDLIRCMPLPIPLTDNENEGRTVGIVDDAWIETNQLWARGRCEPTVTVEHAFYPHFDDFESEQTVTIGGGIEIFYSPRLKAVTVTTGSWAWNGPQPVEVGTL